MNKRVKTNLETIINSDKIKNLFHKDVIEECSKELEEILEKNKILEIDLANTQEILDEIVLELNEAYEQYVELKNKRG